MLLLFIYAYWCPTRLQYQMFVSFSSNTMGGTNRAGTADPSGAPAFMSLSPVVR